jgi:putative oxidoreductase
MVTAIGSVHLPKGFWVTDGGFEYNLMILASSAALAFAGPGAYSLDAVNGLQLAGWLPGLVAVLAGFVLGAGALAGRRTAPVARQS